MDLAPYISALSEELIVAAEAGGPEARAMAERLLPALDAAVRLTLLDALSEAAAEITCDLAPGSVDLRLRARTPVFVVTPPASDDDEEPIVAVEPAASGDEAGVTARINLRLDQDLKDRVERSARDAQVSVNSWLIRAATAALREPAGSPVRRRGGDRFTGWVH